MTDQKPCLPECRHEAGGGQIFLTHAPACKNAKPADRYPYLREEMDSIKSKPAEPQGEPPIDFATALSLAETYREHNPTGTSAQANMARAYLHMAAEVERLRVRVAELESGQPANYHGWCECYSCRKERAFKEVSHNDR